MHDLAISGRAFWIELIIGAALIVAGCGLVPGAQGERCKTTPCTYYVSGQPFAGTCGVKKGDSRQCYCIDNSDKTRVEPQSGCSLPNG